METKMEATVLNGNYVGTTMRIRSVYSLLSSNKLKAPVEFLVVLVVVLV